MTRFSARFPSLAAAALAAACEKDNPGFCGDDCPIDARDIDAVRGCLDNPEICTATQTCLSDVCVDCATASDHQSEQCEDPAAPVCTPDHACRACQADGECDSNFCEAGQCIAADDVVYVTSTGTDTATCSMAAPCGSVLVGMGKIGAPRKYLHIAPSATDYDLVDMPLLINKDVVIRARGAKLIRGQGNQIIDVQGGANVVIDGLTFGGAAGQGNADGLQCSGSTVTLRGVAIVDNRDRGIDAGGCVLDIDRSVISGNVQGGARLVDGHFSIRNTFVFDNRANAGLTLNPNTTPNLLESSTIVKNVGATAGGVACVGGVAIIARNNVIYGNTAPMETTGTNCAHSYSVIGAANPPAGIMVRSMTPIELGLENIATGITVDDFHINTAANPPSLLRGAGDPGAMLTTDFDGDARPNPAGSPPDIGADEVP